MLSWEHLIHQRNTDAIEIYRRLYVAVLIEAVHLVLEWQSSKTHAQKSSSKCEEDSDSQRM